jgi:hypothetical protein
MQIVRIHTLHILVLSSTWFYSCNKWDPDKQFENDIILKREALVLQEEQTKIAKKNEIKNFVRYLGELTAKDGEFLTWSNTQVIPFKITAVATLNQETWETREYNFESLINARYGYQSEISRFYASNRYPESMSIITNGKRIISPIIN